MLEYKKIILSPEIIKEVEAYQKKYNLNSSAQCLRELIKAGLKAKENLSEKTTLKSSKKHSKEEELLVPKKLWLEALTWICEIRLDVRHLVESTPIQPQATGAETLEKYKKVAKRYIEYTYHNG